MTVAGIMMCKDEADIIAASVLNLVRNVDFVIVHWYPWFASGDGNVSRLFS